jgi:hypothetical protein
MAPPPFVFFFQNSVGARATTVSVEKCARSPGHRVAVGSVSVIFQGHGGYKQLTRSRVSVIKNCYYGRVKMIGSDCPSAVPDGVSYSPTAASRTPRRPPTHHIRQSRTHGALFALLAHVLLRDAHSGADSGAVSAANGLAHVREPGRVHVRPDGQR